MITISSSWNIAYQQIQDRCIVGPILIKKKEGIKFEECSCKTI